MLGLPGADEQLVHYAETIRNMGRAGIPVLGFHWMPNGVWRTTWTARTHTGALTNGFDLELAKNAPLTHGRAFEEEELWATFERFVRTLVPVAEEFGVRLALHPDDPPVPTLGGLPRLFRSFEAFRRGLELVDSPALGLDFCVGSWSEMGTDVLEAIRYFGSRDKIVYVHFRDVDGVVPAFTECALGDGNLDPSEVMDALLEVDFEGFAIFDHAPLLVGDEDWPWRGEAHQTGYLMGLLAAKRPRAVR
jgi:mannonate dehydratase